MDEIVMTVKAAREDIETKKELLMYSAIRVHCRRVVCPNWITTVPKYSLELNHSDSDRLKRAPPTEL